MCFERHFLLLFIVDCIIKDAPYIIYQHDLIRVPEIEYDCSVFPIAKPVHRYKSAVLAKDFHFTVWNLCVCVTLFAIIRKQISEIFFLGAFSQI